MRDALIVTALSVLPRNLLARGVGFVAQQALSKALTRGFVWAYGVDLSEALNADVASYGSLEALFTRRLRADARPVDPDPRALVSPVDGTVAWAGASTNGVVPLEGGQSLDVARVLGEVVDGEREVAVLYLSPTDYHRVHAPAQGTVERWRYVPGTLWPVFPAAVRRVPGLFSRNERLVSWLRCAHGDVAVAMIGAFGVGRMEAVFTRIQSNRGAPAEEAPCVPPVPVERGGDLGVFHLGSTVVLVLPEEDWTWRVRTGDSVRMGQALVHVGSP